jgi:hypothetical protein
MLNLLSKRRQTIDKHRRECRSNFQDNNVNITGCQLALLTLLSSQPSSRTYIATFAPKTTLYALCEKELIDENIHPTPLGEDLLQRVVLGKKPDGRRKSK